MIIKKYRKLQIMKHALQYYIGRPGATQKDIRREKNFLKEVTNEVDEYKRSKGIK